MKAMTYEKAEFLIERLLRQPGSWYLVCNESKSITQKPENMSNVLSRIVVPLYYPVALNGMTVEVRNFEREARTNLYAS